MSTQTEPSEITEKEPEPRKPRWWQRALIGVVAALAAVAAGELLSWPLPGNTSPLTAVGSFVIDIVPGWAKNFAIEAFGSNDKLFLTVVMFILVLIVAIVAGLLERPRRPIGSVLIGLFGVFGFAAAITRSGAPWFAVFPSILAGVVGIFVLRVLLHQLEGSQKLIPGLTRRNFMSTASLTGVVAIVAIGVARTAKQATSAVKNFALPKATKTDSIPEGADLKIDGISPYVTDNKDFYRVDTALLVPKIDTANWTLKIHGMVDKEISLNFDDFLKQPMIQRTITLTCVSNEVGGNLAGNAVWIGTLIRDLLKQAGPHADADMVLSKSQDGFTASTPLSVLTDEGRDCIFAVGMNGSPLPAEHGYPVRMVVPGLYGYVSATKWVVDLEVTRFDKAQAYWTPRGYSAQAPIKMSSRIDVPKAFAEVDKGTVAVAGVAWAQHTGISKVQVQVDGGDWADAQLAEVASTDTWRQWKYAWDATSSGNHNLVVRAFDANGKMQISNRAPIVPDGSTGLQSVLVKVK